MLLVLASVMVLGACSSKEETDTKSKTEADVAEKTDNKEEENQGNKENPAEDFYVYEESEGVVAVKYMGTDKYVSVPAEIDGKEITKLGFGGDFYIAYDSESSLKGIKIPDTITCIDRGALLGNDRLEYVILSNKLESIGEQAFSKCEVLEEIVLPDGLLKIDGGAFYSTGLKELTIPESVTYIGDGAFGDTENLQKIYFENGNCEIDDDAFNVGQRISKIVLCAEPGSKVEEHVKAKLDKGLEDRIGFEAK